MQRETGTYSLIIDCNKKIRAFKIRSTDELNHRNSKQKGEKSNLEIIEVRTVEMEKWGLPFRKSRERRKAKESWGQYSRTCLSAFVNCNCNLGTN